MRSEKRIIYEKRYRELNKEKLRVKAREYYLKNKQRMIAKHAKHTRLRRLKQYGISAAEEAAMLEKQKHCCAICRGPSPKSNGGKTWCVDHDHKGGGVRGLLCQNCNILLGHAKDSIDVLRAAIKYLQKHKKQSKLKTNKEINE